MRRISAPDRWDRVGAVTRSGVVYSVIITAALVVLLTLSDRSVMALFMGGGSPALPIARHIHVIATWNFILFGITMVMFATVRANGAVWAPLIILTIGLLPVRFGFIYATDQWLGADAIWWSFPVSSFANVALAVGYYLQGGWKKARMTVEQPCPDEDETHRGSARHPRGRRRADPPGDSPPLGGGRSGSLAHACDEPCKGIEPFRNRPPLPSCKG